MQNKSTANLHIYMNIAHWTSFDFYHVQIDISKLF